MSRKLAIAISGAVSLGSYEAGVMYEVLEAIARHNEKLIKDHPEIEDHPNRVEIDVISGASAGGMTACILAQQLLCQGQFLRDAYNNPLYNAWVREVDIVPLLIVRKCEQKNSLLQKKVVESIGEKYLTNEPPSVITKHPAAASEILVGIAMSNLNGYTYEIEIQSDRIDMPIERDTKFAYTRYQDRFVCSVKQSDGEFKLMEKSRKGDKWEDIHPTSWATLREVGLSSGAFPFAFPPRLIHRYRGEGKYSNRDGKFLYTDGGVFENEPIGLAKSLADQKISSQRFYLFISPGQVKPQENRMTEESADLLNTGIALIKAIFLQARFPDWIMHEIDAPIYSVTTQDNEIIGEVFSAFAGFLEEKFRAYDYNIGRENARAKLKMHVEAGLLHYNPETMPNLEWKVEGKIENQEVKDWSQAKNLLKKFAALDAQGGDLAALKKLMEEVNINTRKEILKQLVSRLDSLVEIANERLDLVDMKDSLWGGFKSTVRNYIGKPLVKWFLKRILRIWLQRNLLNLR
jgi:predicted acylesterase/phospholipase RssA